jgi:N-acyl-L-homoserine lactone synthetase
MRDNQQRATADGSESLGSGFEGILRGYRFSVCTGESDFAAALDVRRRVYQGQCGYDVPVPDDYDQRSWLLLAEHVESGEAVGTMRVTPRSTGPLEAEEYFRLPRHLIEPRTVEVTRFAILPEHRRGHGVLPSVSFGLFKLLINFVNQIGARHAVVCSKEERVWTYEWLCFQRTGLVARYAKLANAEHALLSVDLREMRERRDHRLWEFVFTTRPAEIELPPRSLGFGPVRYLGPRPVPVVAARGE